MHVYARISGTVFHQLFGGFALGVRLCPGFILADHHRRRHGVDGCGGWRSRQTPIVWSGWAFGLGQSVLGLHWLAQAFHYQANLPGWAGWLAVPLLAAYLGVFPALALAFARWLAPELALLMERKFRNRRNHFYWITIIHSGWHDGHHNTGIPLSDIKRRTLNVMKRTGLSCFGMIEFDLFNNWPYARRGLRVTPHVHLLAWSRRPSTPGEIRSRLNLKELRSMNGANVAVVKRVKTRERLAHLCYYMSKPNHLVKSLGQQQPDTPKRTVYSVEKNVRPGHTLRIAEILSYIKISELMMAQGEGRRIKAQLISELESGDAPPSEKHIRETNVRSTWKSMMPASRLGKAHVMVDRDGIL